MGQNWSGPFFTYETLTRHSISSLWSLISSAAATVSLTSLSHGDVWFLYCSTPAMKGPCSPVATKGRSDGYSGGVRRGALDLKEKSTLTQSLIRRAEPCPYQIKGRGLRRGQVTRRPAPQLRSLLFRQPENMNTVDGGNAASSNIAVWIPVWYKKRFFHIFYLHNILSVPELPRLHEYVHRIFQLLFLQVVILLKVNVAFVNSCALI
jgi:hypothetical protein